MSSWGAEAAARKGRMDIIPYLIVMANNTRKILNHILYGACRAGDHDLINFAIKNGANDFKGALVRSGNLEILIKMMKIGKVHNDDISAKGWVLIVEKTKNAEVLEHVMNILVARRDKLYLEAWLAMFKRTVSFNHTAIIDQVINEIVGGPDPKDGLDYLLPYACRDVSVDVILKLIAMGANECNCSASIAEHIEMCVRNGGRY